MSLRTTSVIERGSLYQPENGALLACKSGREGARKFALLQTNRPKGIYTKLLTLRGPETNVPYFCFVVASSIATADQNVTVTHPDLSMSVKKLPT